MSDIFERIDKAKVEVSRLKGEIEKVRSEKADRTMSEVTAEKNLKAVKKPPVVRLRRTLRGHFGKVYAMNWSFDSQSIVSASQDGKLIIWDAWSMSKTNLIPLRSSWVMTCAFEQTQGNLVACGGLDNLCSIFNIAQSPTMRAQQELAAHDGYISCCRFIDEGHIITASGDSSCIRWDIETGEVLNTFSDHTGDVMSVAISPVDKNMFVSGSVDATARLWDIRTTKCVQTHVGHESDINCVDFFPDGNSFGTGSDDSSCRLFDLRCYNQVNSFNNEKILCGITSVAFSKSGRVLFAGYDDFNTIAWDTLDSASTPAFYLPVHENRVSCLGVSPKGDALCTGSWDTLLKVWA